MRLVSVDDPDWFISFKTSHLRYAELKDVVDGLFQQHDHSHLDEEVCQTTTGMALQDAHNTSGSGSAAQFEHLDIREVDVLTSSSLNPARRT